MTRNENTRNLHSAKKEKNDDALMFYQKALKLKKDIPIAHYNIGTIFFKKSPAGIFWDITGFADFVFAFKK